MNGEPRALDGTTASSPAREATEQPPIILRRCACAYLLFAIAIFAATTLGKLTSDFSDSRLSGPDPFLSFMSAGTLMKLIAALEIVVVVILVSAFKRNPFWGVNLTLWLAFLFVAYRVGFQFSPTKADTCKCFGVGSLFGMMKRTEDALSMAILAVLIAGGCSLLVSRWLQLRRRIPGTVITALALLFPGMSSYAQGQDFQPLYVAEGIINEQVLSPGGDVTGSNSFPFKFSVDAAGRWQITWLFYYPHWALTTTEHIAYNGTDVFSVVYGDKHLDRNNKPVPNLPLEDHDHPARVCRGPFAVDHSSAIGLIWIAFVGGDYAKKGNSPEIPDLLVTYPRKDPVAWCTDAAYTLASNAPNALFSTISFTLNKHKIYNDLMSYPQIDEPGVAERVQAFKEALKRLQTHADAFANRSTYELEQTKPYNGMHVPALFKAVRYAPPGASAGSFPFVKWVGQVTNVYGLQAPIPMLPPVFGRITVEDRRFMRRTKLEYVNNWFYSMPTNGWVVSVSDTSFLGTNQVRMNPRQSERSRLTLYWAAIIFFVALSVLPIVHWLRSKTTAKLRNAGSA